MVPHSGGPLDPPPKRFCFRPSRYGSTGFGFSSFLGRFWTITTRIISACVCQTSFDLFSHPGCSWLRFLDRRGRAHFFRRLLFRTFVFWRRRLDLKNEIISQIAKGLVNPEQYKMRRKKYFYLNFNFKIIMRVHFLNQIFKK